MVSMKWIIWKERNVPKYQKQIATKSKSIWSVFAITIQIINIISLLGCVRQVNRQYLIRDQTLPTQYFYYCCKDQEIHLIINSIMLSIKWSQ
jgi:hypothetical protein